LRGKEVEKKRSLVPKEIELQLWGLEFYFHIWGEKEGCNEIAPCGTTSTIDFKDVQDIYYFRTQIH
jgi:hypothetical protein